jgi:hypothetical protein
MCSCKSSIGEEGESQEQVNLSWMIKSQRKDEEREREKEETKK